MLICSEYGWCWCFSLMTAVMLVCHLLLIADLSCTRSVSQESQADCVFWPEQNGYVTAVNVTQQMGDTGFHCPCVCTRKLDTVNVHSTAGYMWFGLRIWQKQIGLWLPRTTEDSDDWSSKSNMARPIRILIWNCLVLWSSCAIMCVLCVCVHRVRRDRPAWSTFRPGTCSPRKSWSKKTMLYRSVSLARPIISTFHLMSFSKCLMINNNNFIIIIIKV